MSFLRQIDTVDRSQRAPSQEAGQEAESTAQHRAQQLSTALVRGQFPVQQTGAQPLQEPNTAAGARGGQDARVPQKVDAPVQRKTELSDGAAGGDAEQGLRSPLFQGIESLLQALLGTRLLRHGCSDSAAVMALQQALTALGHDPGTPDGIWGPKTDAGIRGYQAQNGLVADAIVGPQTMASLDRAFGAGAVGKIRPLDPRIGYNAERNQYGQAIDPEREGKETMLDWLPFHHDGSGWDHRAILSRWSQVDFDPGNLTTTDEVRCAVNVAMSARIIEGPEALVQWCDAVQARGAELMGSVSAERQARIQESGWLIGFHAAKIRASVEFWKGGSAGLPPVASWDDLDKISHYGKLILTERAHEFSSNSEMQEIHTLGSGHSRVLDVVGMQITSRQHMLTILADIRPGESYMVAVDFNTGQGYDLNDKTEIDHVINIGCEPPEKGGKRYLYDSNPKTGSQLRYLQEDGQESEEWFWPYFEVLGQRGVFKQTRIIAATMV